MPRLFIWCLSVLVAAIATPPPAMAQDVPVAPAKRYYVPDMPENLAATDFYLVTVGVGTEVNNRFGHTGIRVHDKVADSDVIFNWGGFSFHEPGFLWKFFRGSLTYFMMVRTARQDIAIYTEDARLMVQERLNLTIKQKYKLMEKIIWNAQPENRKFAYQYWYKNCATIPRDYLDEVVEGQIRARFAAAPSSKVFRDYVRSNLALTLPVASILDVLMNGNIDRPISRWDEMFLPAELRHVLLEMPAVDDDGNPIAGARLLTDTKILVDAVEDYAAPMVDYWSAAALSLAPLGVALAAFGAGRRANGRRRQLAYAALGLAGISFGIISGIFGLTLLTNWLFSGHPDGWHNANLLLFFPVDFFAVVWGIRLLRERACIKDRMPFINAGRLLFAAHLLSFFALLLLYALGVIEQDIRRVSLWFGLPMVAVATAYLKFAFAPTFVPAPVPEAAAAVQPPALSHGKNHGPRRARKAAR